MMAMGSSDHDIGGGVCLFLYALLGCAGVYLAYLSGLVVEARYGGQISLLYFLVAFAVALVVAFPISVAIARSVGKRTS